MFLPYYVHLVGIKELIYWLIFWDV